MLRATTRRILSTEVLGRSSLRCSSHLSGRSLASFPSNAIHSRHFSRVGIDSTDSKTRSSQVPFSLPSTALLQYDSSVFLSRSFSSAPKMNPKTAEFDPSDLEVLHHKADKSRPNVFVYQPSKALNRKRLVQHQEKLDSTLQKHGEMVIRVKNIEKDLPKYSERAIVGIKKIPQLSLKALQATRNALVMVVKEPGKAKESLAGLKQKVKDEAKHYWLGTKLLFADVSTSYRIVRRILHGNMLSRRERRQLHNTVTDLLRLVPFSFFIIVPFMEAFLPLALRLFPSMLPSTYQASYEKEEKVKKELQLRLSLAKFLQETVKETIADRKASEDISEETEIRADEVLEFVEKAQNGVHVSSEEILKFASLFNDELMLDNISRPQLVAMCRYMGTSSIGGDSMLRYTLRSQISRLKKDDSAILWEGLDTLSKEELQACCRERGMRSMGLTKIGYKRQMESWLDLSINKNVPTSLLIISRAMNITASMDKNFEEALVTSMSSIEDEVVKEVALEQSRKENEDSMALRELKLESIKYQNELIEDEEKELKEQERTRKEQEKEKDITVSENDVASTSSDVNKSDLGELPDAEADVEVEDRELTVEDVSALESLAQRSALEKEKQELGSMKSLHELHLQEREADIEQRNCPTNKMLKKIGNMIDSLEKQANEADKAIGDRLKVLDKDNDGIIDTQELKNAVRNVLNKYNTEEDADWAVNQIDEDKDGKVTVSELMEWVEKRSNADLSASPTKTKC